MEEQACREEGTAHDCLIFMSLSPWFQIFCWLVSCSMTLWISHQDGGKGISSAAVMSKENCMTEGHATSSN